MKKFITKDNIDKFAYINHSCIKKPIKGIVVRLHGYGWCGLLTEPCDRDIRYGEAGILAIYPYYSPWAWMSDASISFIDELVDKAIELYDLPDDIPVVSEGGSMGGQGALVYSLYAKRTPICCCTDSPVCDMLGLVSDEEHADAITSVYNSYYNEEGNLEDKMIKKSPIELVDKLPKIPYYIIAGTADTIVYTDKHAIPFAQKMKDHGYDIRLDVIEGYEHCAINAYPEKLNEYLDYMINMILNYKK